jgi:CRISPR-associated endonuclease/helicase Cas3
MTSSQAQSSRRTNLAPEARILFARYWGKADPNLSQKDSDHHTVLGHSLDVAASAFCLVERSLPLRRQLSARSGIREETAAITFAAICALHDVGKLDTRFQRKAPAVADRLRPESANVKELRYDHGTEGFLQLEDDEEDRAILESRLGPGVWPLVRAVCGHHGRLPPPDEPDPSRSTLPPSLRREDEKARRTFIDVLLDFFAEVGAQLPWPDSIDGSTVQSLAGLCAVADWIGSNVDHFPYEPVPSDLTTYWNRACERASRAVKEAGLLRAAPGRATFGDLFPGYSPRDVQILTESLHLHEPALVIVEAEMGKGKTEAALSLAARYLTNGAADGITVALPTMATSNAMFARVEDLVPRLFPEGEVQVALAHGRARRQPRFQRLVERSLRARDKDAPEASVVCARWLLNRKRILLAQVGVGTIDQGLQAALVVRHQFVRMFALSRNVVVIDEVHAYDAYMEVLLEHLLSWLGALEVPVVLLSATLPSERRAALARAWRGEAAGELPNDDLERAWSRPYPLVSVTTQSGTVTHHLGEPPVSRVIGLELARRAGEESAYLDVVAERLVSAAKRGARIVWIRNTVGEAQRAYQAVARCAAEIPRLLFHARFRGRDRSTIEEQALREYGKNAEAGGRVLVATQVVEQSLDLDFDEMHTDLAPIDLLLQRAGRLHRHDRARPGGFDRPRLVIHVPSEEDVAQLRFGPSQFVYDVGTLWITERELRERTSIELPGDIRPLVERCYHAISRATLLSAGGEALVESDKRLENQLRARRTRAIQCCIPRASADPIGAEAMDDDDEDVVRAFTRDGISVTLLPFWWDGEGARTLDADAEEPPWHLDADAPDAWRLASTLLDETLSLPARGGAEGKPGRKTSAWENWKARFARFADEAGLGKRIVPLPLSREGSAHEGRLGLGNRERRVLYDPTLGLFMLRDLDEEEE